MQSAKNTQPNDEIGIIHVTVVCISRNCQEGDALSVASSSGPCFQFYVKDTSMIHAERLLEWNKGTDFNSLKIGDNNDTQKVTNSISQIVSALTNSFLQS